MTWRFAISLLLEGTHPKSVIWSLNHWNPVLGQGVVWMMGCSWRAVFTDGGRRGDRPVTNGKICSVVGSWGTCSLSIRMSVKCRRLVLCVCLALGKRWPHTSASAASAPHASGWHEDLGFLKVTGSEDVPVFDILWPYCKHRSVIWWLVADGICIRSHLSGLLNVSG